MDLARVLQRARSIGFGWGDYEGTNLGTPVFNEDFVMTTLDHISQHLQTLPEPVLREVLDFVEFLKSRHKIPKDREEDTMWTDLSLTSAMRGLEDEEAPYTLTDIKESFR